MKKATKKASVGNIARLAGVSTAAASYALKNQPGVSPATRERVLRIAKEVGYAPDARIDNWMARVRDAKSKELMPIVWLNTGDEKDAWHRYRFQTPYLEGAIKRALELGYKLEEIWTGEKGITIQRISKSLYSRGVEGVIIPFPVRHLRLGWDYLASVAIGESLMAPRLHRITADINFNLLLALKYLRRLRFRRIGICMSHEIDIGSRYSVRSTARDLYFSASRRDQIPPLFHQPYWKKGGNPEQKRKEMVAWLKRYKPEVIVGHDYRHRQWVEEAGFRIPEEVGLVHLAVDDDALDWAGINSRRREIGATAVEWLVSLMRNHQFGVPETALTTLIRGSWQAGQTLGTPPTLNTETAAQKARRAVKYAAS